MLTCGIFEDIEIEISKRLNALENSENDTFSEKIWNVGLKKLDYNEQQYLINILSFASSLDYHHPGLTTKVYLAHPIRVAGMAILFSQKTEKKIIGAISLLHNVLEVSSITYEKLESEVGPVVGSSIKTLTVERGLQDNTDYLNNYYNAIASTSHSLSIVKIVDKLDNLFLLGLNPDDAVRKRYLNEINNYILPLVKQFLPGLTHYFEKLVEFNEENGLIDKKKYL
jgi:(p)ppGpp synthase/HD superfamily hydrolase